MKKTIYLLLVTMLSYSCKAQVNLVPIQVDNYVMYLQANDYLIDSDNLLNPYVGTWLYNNGSTSLKFVLRKAINSSQEDVIYGECEYIENNVLKMNTLPFIDAVFPTKYYHTITGNYIVSKNRIPACDACGENEVRLVVKLSDKIKPITGHVYLRATTVSGQPALIADVRFDGIHWDEDGNSTFVGSTIPNKYYIMINQP